MRSRFPASNELPSGLSRRCSCRVCSLNGVGAYKACRLATSPCPVVGEIPVKAVVSPVVPVAEAPLSWCPVLPVNGLLEQDQSPCGRGSIVVCVVDCRLGSVVVPSGCDVGCSCSSMESKGTTCAFPFGLASE